AMQNRPRPTKAGEALLGWLQPKLSQLEAKYNLPTGLLRSVAIMMGIPENSRIREQKQKYLRNKSYLHDVTLRAEPYMYWIAGQVK
ncbi:hypothetical protein MJN47_29095, partial [Salmonella enterica subsp. enterica serovar Lubbock]|nr:hypothetical protein [Salmonella enterica subsp. enterica serovar Lubbock]